MSSIRSQFPREINGGRNLVNMSPSESDVFHPAVNNSTGGTSATASPSSQPPAIGGSGSVVNPFSIGAISGSARVATAYVLSAVNADPNGSHNGAVMACEHFKIVIGLSASTFIERTNAIYGVTSLLPQTTHTIVARQKLLEWACRPDDTRPPITVGE